jgi:hypothetical protein
LASPYRPEAELPDIPYEGWSATKDTLHLWCQIVGKVKLATTARLNHWWNAPLYVDVRGLTTRLMRHAGITFRIDFDLLEHRLEVATSDGRREALALTDGLSVAELDTGLHAMLATLGIDVTIREQPFGVPMTTPFPEDREHAAYDAAAVQRFWRALDWVDDVFHDFSGRFAGKQSPVHLFWHSFDLAVTRFSGRPAPPIEGADSVTREAYSHEAISFGFWAGDQNVPHASFYSYTAPEPPGLRDRRLRPGQAMWKELPTGSLALLPYDIVRAAPDPRATLLDFLESAYLAGAGAAGWDVDGLAHST